MITSADIGKIIEKYDQTKLAIGTLGSHSSLNIFKGAKEEGFRTVCICKEKDAIMYQKYPLVDELIIVKDFTELLSEQLQERLRKLNVVLIPHGSFTAYLSTEQLTDSLMVPMFGNRQLLHWEANRKSQEEWLRQAGLRLPATFKTPEDIDRLIIAKLQGAKGGRGYFLANSPKNFPQEIQRNGQTRHAHKGRLAKHSPAGVRIRRERLPKLLQQHHKQRRGNALRWTDATNPPWTPSAKSPPANSSKST